MNQVAHRDDPFVGLRAPPKEEVVLCRRNLRVTGKLTSYAQSASVVIAMPLHNQASTLRAALESAISQRLTEGHCAVALLDDQSTDNWQQEVTDLLLHPAIIVLSGHCGNAALARNAILDFVEMELPSARWVARLDSDDLLCSETSVDALVSAGEAKGASFVIGSNHLVHDNVQVKPSNIANPEILLDRERLVGFIEDFCFARAANELPSCNLLIRTGYGIRYPSLHSAEDHWLVAQLLMFRPDEAVIVPYPVYCHYTLKGQTTTSNEQLGSYRQAREKMAMASRAWLAALSEPGELLGFGMEGCVWRQGEFVVKRFYPAIANQADIARLAELSHGANGRLPVFEYSIEEVGSLVCRYPWTRLDPVGKHIPIQQVRGFLLDLAQAGLVASNIKRDNLRYDAGRLTYIDIGRDIQPYIPSAFLDSSARLYTIGVLGLPDGELVRRPSYHKQHEALAQLDGFEGFYGDLIAELHPLAKLPPEIQQQSPVADDITLLIKACPQDHATLQEQVAHIVYQLSEPRHFSKVVLVIDPFVGTYLRNYADGNLKALIDSAEHLQATGVIDAVWVAPQDTELVGDLYARWFAIQGIKATHTASGAPLFAQLWAFEQVSTRYVLQTDLDVMIGRKGHTHDYLQEMLEAVQHVQTWCVGFNIPKLHAGFKPYTSQAEVFVPEIRLGLLDLWKIRANLPLPNETTDGHLIKMWHRSMEEAQRACGMQSVRGGDDRTYYVHPTNDIKVSSDLEVERDLIGQGIYPSSQAEHWDLVLGAQWQYPTRSENIVFLLKGRDTPLSKLRRCLESLRQQFDQDFGIILIDDASAPVHSWNLDHYLGSLKPRTTLVRRRMRRGYIPNFLLAAQLCDRPDILIAVLDQDDVLMSRQVVSSLKKAKDQGADLINGLMYRPNKPTRYYLADYESPRSKGGGNTWTHLRAFTKALFDNVPTDEYMVDGKWISEVSDYATMLPMAEIARKPMQLLDQFYLWHERGEYSPERKLEQARIIQDLLDRPALNLEPSRIS